ncbi:MAG: hypothetical protein DIAAKJNI_00322 [Candidatus Argoarchaeum ethanivorans]|uniref:Response receiver domain-containing protein n=1 Tax=Candidatus Argoarchaeum ethanivorans TaxID=2608793 RepID=A0A811T9Z7_9EURY|nr:MAG: hypothetical protein DIAAKJNI_00322 [Candidatus Argoarchaeum ethanivorans]
MANEIIQNAIHSAICVDNAFVEPYSDAVIEDDEETPKKLFESFRKSNCSLDIYRYIDMSKWERDREYILGNRDLLILDWELTGDPPFRDALEILWEAVKLPSLPFVLIYTQEPDISLIELNIHSVFGTPYGDISERKRRYEEFCEKLEDEIEIDDPNRLFESISAECKELILARGDRETIKKGIIKHIGEYYGDEYHESLIGKMVKCGKSTLNISKIDGVLEFVGFYFGNAMVNTTGSPVQVSPIEGDTHSFVIYNTTIIIFVKPKMSSTGGDFVILPDQVYTHFAECIYKCPRNFLSLLYLEMKNLYQEHSGVIGRELYDIDEVAFFHHQKNLDSEDDFYDFLRTLWKDQLSAFDFIQNPKLFSVLQEYKREQGIEMKIKRCKKDNLEILEKGLVKLNYYYSFLQMDRKENDSVRFGDMFLLSKDIGGKEAIGFVLCITPHCDCLHPENINNKFHFVFGSKSSIKNGLDSAEGGFNSFLIYENEPICVNWTGKPFTLYIHEDRNNISSIQVEYHGSAHGSAHYLSYTKTQKENYTQRIANRAFSCASRVGINLAELKIEKTNNEDK